MEEINMKRILLLSILIMSTGAFASADRYLNGKYITNGAYLITLPNATVDMSSLTSLSGANSGDVTLGTASGLSLSGQALSLGLASSGVTGALSGSDWSTFSAKLTSPMTASGDLIYGGASGAATALLGNITATKKFLSQTGTGSVSAAPSWSVVSASDVGLSAVTNDAQVKKADYTTKSGILIATGASTYVELATAGAGDNGKVLMAASGQASGLQWTAIPTTTPGLSGTDGSPTIVTAAGGVQVQLMIIFISYRQLLLLQSLLIRKLLQVQMLDKSLLSLLKMQRILLRFQMAQASN
jgi:hypothetical protein